MSFLTNTSGPAVCLAALSVALTGCQTFEDAAKVSSKSAPAVELTAAPSAGGASVAVVTPSDTSDETAFVMPILASLTLEQKVAQMIQPDIRYVTPADVRRYGIGSILNGGGAFPGMDKHSSVEDWRALADQFHEASVDQSEGGAGIPIVWGTDAVHGHNNVFGATVFPHNVGLGATGNPELVAAIGEATAREVRETGIDWIFAPTVAVATDFRWGRTYESYGSDPALVADMGAALVEGIQRGGAIATAKHFIGDGGTWEGIDQGDTLLSKDELVTVHGAGYRAAIDADVQTVMASFNSWNGDKVHGNRELLTDVLRGDMNFGGVVVSDWNGIGQVRFCSNTSCPQAFNAGIDIAMVPTQWKELLENTIEEVRSGEIPEARVDEAVERILRLKYRLGLFDGRTPSERAAAPDLIASPLGNAEHQALAAQAVRESLVLLKHRGGVLPLEDSQRILVTGSAAHSLEHQTGGWSLSWQGTGNENDDFPSGTSVFQGIAQQMADGSGSVELSVDGSYESRPDVAVVVFGEHPYAEGEGDVTHLNHSARYPRDLALLKQLRADGIPVISIFVTGRPAWVNAELNASDAFVVAWLPGTEGAAVADVLFAAKGSEHDFKGRLTMAWPGADVNAQDVSLPVAETLFPIGHGMSLDELSEAIAYSEVPLAEEEVPEAVVFSRRSQPPWILMIGDAYNWDLRVSASSASSQGERIHVEAIDKDVQQDARSLRWTTTHGEPAQAFWSHLTEGSVDFSEALRHDGVMAIQMRVDEAPTGKVIARMDCRYPCRGEVEITDMLKDHSGDDWFDLLIPVACFAQGGAKLEEISAPLVLVSDGELSMSVSDVRFRSRRDGDHTHECGGQLAQSAD